MVRRQPQVLPPDVAPGQENVAAASAKILADAESALADLRARVETAEAADFRSAVQASGTLAELDAERLQVDIDAGFRADRATIAEIRRDLTAVHSRLDQISEGIVALQTHSLRQTGGVALALSVLLAIAWKVIAG
jgi:hypothetical protein